MRLINELFFTMLFSALNDVIDVINDLMCSKSEIRSFPLAQINQILQ